MDDLIRFSSFCSDFSALIKRTTIPVSTYQAIKVTKPVISEVSTNGT